MAVRPEKRAGVEDADLSGTTVFVTGSSDGIGRETAIALARLGARVLVHGRDRRKAERVVGRIENAGGEARAYTADFTSLDEVRDLATRIWDDTERIEALANNAGAYFREARRTDDGIEATMAVNHLAPFLLTHLLLPVIPEDGRIVTTSSDVHHRVDLDPTALEEIEDYDGLDAYSRSKLANVLFTRELARRLDDRTANCFHPGFVPGSAIWRDAPVYVRAVTNTLGGLPDTVTRQFVDTPATGAATLVYLVASQAVADVTGEYFSDCEPEKPSEVARDDDLAGRLWEESEELVELDMDERIGRG